MHCRFAPRIAVACLVLAASQPLVSQPSSPALPPGTHEYLVRGWYQDIAMEPWSSTLSARDTTVDGATGTRATYRARQSGDGWLYTYTALWSSVSPSVRATWVMAGHAQGTCHVVADKGELTGTLDDGTIPTPVRATGTMVPDFAIGAYLAGRTLTAGDTILLTLFRCMPLNGRSAIEAWPVVGVVSTGAETRGAAGQPEPAWIVDAGKDRGFTVVLAVRDRMLLRLETPQGPTGLMTEAYARTR